MKLGQRIQLKAERNGQRKVNPVPDSIKFGRRIGRKEKSNWKFETILLGNYPLYQNLQCLSLAVER